MRSQLVRYIILLTLTISCTPNRPVKNIILLIGDGMGPGQISLLQQFLKHSKLHKSENAFDKISKLGFVGISDTAPHGKLVVDSACSATQLALGKPALNEFIGLDHLGNPQATILEKAQNKGLMTGLVSDTRLTHATPASFAAHVHNRWEEDEIAMGMIASNVDVLYSGGAYRFYPKGTQLNIKGFQIKSRRADDKNPIKLAQENNYQIIHSKSDLNNINPSKVLGLFTNGSYPSSIWHHQNESKEDRTIPNLLEMTKSALSILNNAHNKKGFFLMVEAGQIDWAGHANDAGTMLHEMLTMNEVLNYLIEYVQNNQDTLLVVTADHETGSFGLGYNLHDVPKPSDLSSKFFKDKKYQVNYNYGPTNVLDLLYQQKESFNALISNFLKLETKEQTPENFSALVNKISQIKITLEEAKDILKKSKNPYYDKEKKYLNYKYWATREEYTAYYPNEVNNISAKLAEKIAHKVNIVWGTGGHTSNPVHVYALGPKYWSKKF
jgi:alkaline phosphatase